MDAMREMLRQLSFDYRMAKKDVPKGKSIRIKAYFDGREIDVLKLMEISSGYICISTRDEKNRECHYYIQEHRVYFMLTVIDSHADEKDIGFSVATTPASK